MTFYTQSLPLERGMYLLLASLNRMSKVDVICSCSIPEWRRLEPWMSLSET